MSPRASLIIFTNLYPTPGDPQRGVFIAQLAQALAQQRRVVVVCPLPKLPRRAWLRRWFSAAPPDDNLPDRRNDGAVEVHYLRYPLLPKVSEYIHAGLMFWFCRRAFRAIVARERPQAVLGQWIYPDGVAAALMIGRRAPLILTALGSDINRDLPRALIGAQIRWALRHAAHVTTVSEPLRRRLAPFVASARLSYVPTGVDQERFAPRNRDAARAALGLGAAGKIVIAIGRLVAVKDHATLVRALAQLGAAERPKVFIVGDGPLRGMLEALVQELRLSEAVYLLGARPHSELPQWLAACDALCLPSLNEGQPNVLLESFASGRPALASAVGGIPDLINATNGRLFPAGDAVQLAQGLRALLNQTWDPTAIRATIAAHRFERQAQSYISLVDRLNPNPDLHAAVY